MPQNNNNPLVVQGDRSLLLDVHTPLSHECAASLIPFAELERSPEHLHTYRLTALSLWNAATSGFSAQDIIDTLARYSRYDVPQSVVQWIVATHARFGRIVMRTLGGEEVAGEIKQAIEEKSAANAQQEGENTLSVCTGQEIGQDGLPRLMLVTDTPILAREVGGMKALEKYLTPSMRGLASDKCTFLLDASARGTVKQILTSALWPVKDEAPLTDGEPLEMSLRTQTARGVPFAPREYQVAAAQSIIGDGGAGTGFGTVVLPCGAGKTLVGMLIMARLKTHTLILTTNISAARQWITELLDKTTLTKDDVAEYTGETKEIAPVTVATYQVLTWRPHKEGPYPHFSLFRQHHWGLVIYDEVHTLPAPVFRVAAEVQSMRRLGLTATLVREDGHETDVFSLVGPKRYDVPWKELEKAHWIAAAECIEVRLGMAEETEAEYASSTERMKHRVASENPAKFDIVEAIVAASPDDKILVIGQYLSSLKEIARRLNAPLITGQTHTTERDATYAAFRNGEVSIIVVSKVANFAIDLPDASMAIQVSGTFGSRQEEAQRLGRILRPKDKKVRFFTLITRDTVEEDFGGNRQKFLAEQGYSYRIVRYDSAEDIAAVVGDDDKHTGAECIGGQLPSEESSISEQLQSEKSHTEGKQE